MNDEQVVEVMAEFLADSTSQPEAEAGLLLDALRGAGFDVYRPDESIVSAFDGTLVESGWCKAHQYPAERYSDGGIACWWESIVEADGYHEPDDFMPCRLVPVGGEG